LNTNIEEQRILLGTHCSLPLTLHQTCTDNGILKKIKLFLYSP
jgi:hypothetical protein